MRKRIAASVTAGCLALLLLSACGLSDAEEGTVPDYTYTPATATESPYGSDADIPDEPETEGVKLNENELASLNKMLFGNRYGENWYYRSVPVLWSTDDPADIDLYTLFYNGFVGECDNLTDEEILFLAEETGYSINDIQSMGQLRLPEDKMDLVLREYYGITLMESRRIGLENCFYFSATNCYYMLHNDAYSVSVGIHSAYEQADGGFIIYYSADEKHPAPEYVMQLVPNEYGSYTITENKPVS